ncbi:hypothetical protein E0K89_007700 [Aquicoccus sp. SCR17]|nr:hypothetical protein [Carideicomes alvinocaridis]
MTLSDFAATGLAVRRADGPPPARVQVIGERSSGTNFVKRLLGRNTALVPTEALGWKHGFCQALAIPAELAVVVVVRRADDWALSMHSRPWHATPALQRLPFADFLRAPWDSVIDRPRYFPGQEEALGQPLQQDRDPLTGEPFPDIFALRQAKLAAHLGFAERGGSVALLRLETVRNDPQAALERIAEGFGLPAPEGPFRPVVKRLGNRFRPAIEDRPETPDALSAADMAFLRSRVDTAQEAALGYRY